MKSNRTAVKALRSGCGKCSERGLGPCADGIAAAKKKMEARGPDGRRRVIRADCRGDLGRIVAGTCAGLPRGLPSGDAAVSTGVVLRLRGPGGRWSGGASGVSDGCGNLCRVAAGASERRRRGVNGPRVAFAGSGRVKNGNRGVKQLSAAGSRGPGDVSGRRVSGIARLGWLEGKKREGAGRSGRFGRNSRNNRRGCSFAGPGRGVSGRQLSEDVSGWQRSGAPGLLCGCPLRNAERASGAVVPSSSAGLWADARNRYVPGLREPGGFGTDDVCRLPGQRSGRSWGRGGVLCRGRRGRVWADGVVPLLRGVGRI